jgi:hypothetical protein
LLSARARRAQRNFKGIGDCLHKAALLLVYRTMRPLDLSVKSIVYL